jgi:DNA ligase D-like protein (predicted ligase)
MKLPEKIQPMLAVTAEPFDSPAYLFELKWDGLRALAFLNGGTRLQSRNLREISAQYPELAFLHRQVKKAGTILDGEIIALADGKPSFQRLTSRMHLTSPPGIRRGMRENPVLYVAFDLLYYDGRPLLQEPCQKRQELLQAVVTPGDSLLISTGLPEQGRKLFQLAAEQGLEGVMGKEKDSPYLPGKRSPFWKKIRVTRSAPFLICGYTTNPAGRRDLSALILGAYAGEGRGRAPARTVLRPCGLVGAGLSQEEIDHLLSLLKPLVTAASPFTGGSLSFPGSTQVHWVRPELVCEVEYLEITTSGQLRHPLYRGLRPETAPAACRLPEK